jgi:hypothetical protein
VKELGWGGEPKTEARHVRAKFLANEEMEVWKNGFASNLLWKGGVSNNGAIVLPFDHYYAAGLHVLEELRKCQESRGIPGLKGLVIADFIKAVEGRDEYGHILGTRVWMSGLLCSHVVFCDSEEAKKFQNAQKSDAPSKQAEAAKQERLVPHYVVEDVQIDGDDDDDAAVLHYGSSEISLEDAVSVADVLELYRQSESAQTNNAVFTLGGARMTPTRFFQVVAKRQENAGDDGVLNVMHCMGAFMVHHTEAMEKSQDKHLLERAAKDFADRKEREAIRKNALEQQASRDSMFLDAMKDVVKVFTDNQKKLLKRVEQSEQRLLKLVETVTANTEQKLLEHLSRTEQSLRSEIKTVLGKTED